MFGNWRTSPSTFAQVPRISKFSQLDPRQQVARRATLRYALQTSLIHEYDLLEACHVCSSQDTFHGPRLAATGNAPLWLRTVTAHFCAAQRESRSFSVHVAPAPMFFLWRLLPLHLRMRWWSLLHTRWPLPTGLPLKDSRSQVSMPGPNVREGLIRQGPRNPQKGSIH